VVEIDFPTVEPNACTVQTFVTGVRQGCQEGLLKYLTCVIGAGAETNRGLLRCGLLPPV
jgi:hypothetical protein